VYANIAAQVFFKVWFKGTPRNFMRPLLLAKRTK